MRNSNAKWRRNISYKRETMIALNGEVIIAARARVRWHKARVPGTIRNSRKPGGNGFRGMKQWVTNSQEGSSRLATEVIARGM